MRFISNGTLVRHYYAVASLHRLHGVVLPGTKPQNIDFILDTYIDMHIHISRYPINRTVNVKYVT